MLVIVSDLHLCDGTTGATLSPGAIALLAERLQALAYSASWRADGRYRPLERLDLVLLGDVLDVIRSTSWNLQSGVRPWSNPHASEFYDQLTRITHDILANNESSLAMLRGLATEGGVVLPPALNSGKPAADGELIRLPVRIHYMVGNHDWFYHLSGPRFDALRKVLIARMGLANRPERPFPHDPVESEELLHLMRRHKVTARHGDLFDPLNFEGDRDTSSLGDVIVVELVNRFAAEVEARLGNELPGATIAGLRELDNVRPLLLIPVWIDGLLARTCPHPAMRKRVKTIWDRLAEEFLAIDFVRQRDTWCPFDVLDGLQRALTFSKRLSIGWASSIVQWLHQIRGAETDSYYPHALSEADFRNRRAKHIVYGHTHAAESIPLDASYAEGFVLDQVYFNAGTWRRIHRPTQLAPGQHEFIASDALNFLAFYQGNERGGRPYETWSGTLGYTHTEVAIHRIDAGRLSPGRVNHGTGQPNAGQSISTPTLHERPPHFAASPSATRGAPTRRI